jgi:hypothetical protein
VATRPARKTDLRTVAHPEGRWFQATLSRHCTLLWSDYCRWRVNSGVHAQTSRRGGILRERERERERERGGGWQRYRQLHRSRRRSRTSRTKQGKSKINMHGRRIRAFRRAGWWTRICAPLVLLGLLVGGAQSEGNFTNSKFTQALLHNPRTVLAHLHC